MFFVNSSCFFDKTSVVYVVGRVDHLLYEVKIQEYAGGMAAKD